MNNCFKQPDSVNNGTQFELWLDNFLNQDRSAFLGIILGLFGIYAISLIAFTGSVELLRKSIKKSTYRKIEDSLSKQVKVYSNVCPGTFNSIVSCKDINQFASETGYKLAFNPIALENLPYKWNPNELDLLVDYVGWVNKKSDKFYYLPRNIDKSLNGAFIELN